MTRQVQDAYIVAATRTPVGKAPRGMFKNVRPDDMLAHVLKIALSQCPGLDPRAIDVGAVERAEVVQVPLLAAADKQRVVTRDGDVVKEHLGVRSAADARALAVHGEALADAPTARADHERRPTRGDIVDLDRYELAGLVDAIGRRDRLSCRLGALEQRSASLAVVGALDVDEAALCAVQGHRGCPPL